MKRANGLARSEFYVARVSGFSETRWKSLIRLLFLGNKLLAGHVNSRPSAFNSSPVFAFPVEG